MNDTIPLPEPVHGFYAAPMFTADQMHAHAAAVSSDKDAENDRLSDRVHMLLSEQSKALADNAALRERVRVLEDALREYVNHDLLTMTRGKMFDKARAALGDKTTPPPSPFPRS